jgi:hypothetical protein
VQKLVLDPRALAVVVGRVLFHPTVNFAVKHHREAGFLPRNCTIQSTSSPVVRASLGETLVQRRRRSRLDELCPRRCCCRSSVAATEAFRRRRSAPPSSSHGGVDPIEAWERRQQRRLPRRGAAKRLRFLASASGTCTFAGSQRSTRATPRRLLRRDAATVEAARCCVESFLPTKTTRPPPTTTMAEVQPRGNKPPPPTDRPTESLAAMLLSPPPTRAAAGRRSPRRTVLEDYNEDNSTIQRPDGCSKPFCAYGTSLARIDRLLPWPWSRGCADSFAELLVSHVRLVDSCSRGRFCTRQHSRGDDCAAPGTETPKLEQRG